MDSIAREATGYIEAPNAYQQSMQAFYDFHYLLADSLMAESVRQMRDSLAGRPDEETALCIVTGTAQPQLDRHFCPKTRRCHRRRPRMPEAG
jgi:hypothetical protein